jgi:HEPN domain-containing protein
MKAFLAYHERPFRKTHNLTELGGAVAKIEPTLAELMREASLMTEFAWRFRYPGDQASVSERDAVRSIELAARVLGEVQENLPRTCTPE